MKFSYHDLWVSKFDWKSSFITWWQIANVRGHWLTIIKLATSERNNCSCHNLETWILLTSLDEREKKDPSGFWFTLPKRQINLLRVAGTSEKSYPNSGIEILRWCIPRRDNLGRRIFSHNARSFGSNILVVNSYTNDIALSALLQVLMVLWIILFFHFPQDTHFSTFTC